MFVFCILCRKRNEVRMNFYYKAASQNTNGIPLFINVLAVLKKQFCLSGPFELCLPTLVQSPRILKTCKFAFKKITLIQKIK